MLDGKIAEGDSLLDGELEAGAGSGSGRGLRSSGGLRSGWGSRGSGSGGSTTSDTLGGRTGSGDVELDVLRKLLLLVGELGHGLGRVLASCAVTGDLHARTSMSLRPGGAHEEGACARTWMFSAWTKPVSLRTLFLILPFWRASASASDAAASIAGLKSDVSASSAASRMALTAARVSADTVARSTPWKGVMKTAAASASALPATPSEIWKSA